MPCCGNTLATHGCYFFFSSPATKLQTHRFPESRWRPTPWILACPISAHQASGSGPPEAFGTRGTTAENVVLVAYRKIPKIKVQVLSFFRYQCGGPLRRSSLPAKSGMSWIQRMNQSLSVPDLSIGVVLNPAPCLIHKFGCEGRSRQSTTYSKGDPCDIFAVRISLLCGVCCRQGSVRQISPYQKQKKAICTVSVPFCRIVVVGVDAIV